MDEGESQNFFSFLYYEFSWYKLYTDGINLQRHAGIFYVVKVQCIQQWGFASCNKLRLYLVRGQLNITSGKRTLLNTNICL